MIDITSYNKSALLEDFPCLSTSLFISVFFLYLFNTGFTASAEEAPSGSKVKLKGKISLSNKLSENGQFDNATLILQKGTMDNSILTGSTEKESLEMNIKWDKWKNRVRKKVWKNFNVRFTGGDAFYLGPFMIKYGEEPPVDLPLGACTEYSYEITSDRHILNARIDKSSGNNRMDDLVLRSVLSMNKKRMLKFPKGSQRHKVRISDSIEIVKNGTFHYRHYNDIETINIEN